MADNVYGTSPKAKVILRSLSKFSQRTNYDSQTHGMSEDSMEGTFRRSSQMEANGPGEQLLNIEIPKVQYKDKLRACQEALMRANEEIQSLT